MTAPTTRETADHAELAACPFCGGSAALHDGMGEFWVRCDDCNASGAMRSRKERAIRDWNGRAPQAALLSEIAALRDYGRDVAKEALEYRRQRDELRKALERIAYTPDGEDGLSLNESVDLAHQTIANQGADQ